MVQLDVTGSRPGMPTVSGEAGVATQYGFLLPPGGRVAAYVRSGGRQDFDPPYINGKLVTTLAAGLQRCRSGRNDIVMVLPGHTETVSDATMFDNLVSGCHVMGVGFGSNRPTFTFSATGSQWTLDQANVILSNLNIAMTGANGIVKAILITGANTIITGCDINVGTGASNHALIAVEFGTGSGGSMLLNNDIHSAADTGATHVIHVGAAVDGLRIEGNDVFAATAGVAVGVIRIEAAATRLRIRHNVLANNLTSAETVISNGAVASSGDISYNAVSSQAGAPVSDTIELGASSLIRCFENYGTDTKATSGLLTPAVVT